MAVKTYGRVRRLHPLVHDEAFRIAGEALRNALHHANANRIESAYAMTGGALTMTSCLRAKSRATMD